jgi:hypothetical protein
VGANQRIVDRLIPEFISHQQQKAKDYNGSLPGFPDGFENADVLGVKGQFAEIWRKIWKLKKGMWDGEQLVNEGVREILMDLIGHCFLAIDMLDRQAEPIPHISAEQELAAWDEARRRGISVAVKEKCTEVCAQGHLYRGGCRFRKPVSSGLIPIIPQVAP